MNLLLKVLLLYLLFFIYLLISYSQFLEFFLKLSFLHLLVVVILRQTFVIFVCIFQFAAQEIDLIPQLADLELQSLVLSFLFFSLASYFSALLL